jgi:DNA-binding NarL/FixJ family response regulator
MTVRVLLADDQTLVRAGFRRLLERADDIEVVGEAADGDEAITLARTHRPDVVLMDVRMPGTDGLAATRAILSDEALAGTKVVMLTTFDLDEYVHRALRAGAVGFLLKDTPPVELARAVRTVAAGNAMLAPTVTKRLISSFAGQDPAPAQQARDRLAVLTGREREVIDAVARGLSNAQIGTELSMSEATVKAHVSRALGKLGLANRVQAAILVHEATP